MNADDDEPEIPALNKKPNESDDSFYFEVSEEEVEFCKLRLLIGSKPKTSVNVRLHRSQTHI